MDDVVILATSRAGAERALQGYIEVARDFGLTVSIPKTKIMASGRTVQHSDEGPIELDDNNYIEAVTEFQYLGSLVERSGRVDADIERRMMQTSRAFGCLHRAVFKDRDLTVQTNRNVYQACVLSVLLYGSECWTLLRKHKKKLDAFHHRYI